MRRRCKPTKEQIEEREKGTSARNDRETEREKAKRRDREKERKRKSQRKSTLRG